MIKIIVLAASLLLYCTSYCQTIKCRATEYTIMDKDGNNPENRNEKSKWFKVDDLAFIDLPNKKISVYHPDDNFEYLLVGKPKVTQDEKLNASRYYFSAVNYDNKAMNVEVVIFKEPIDGHSVTLIFYDGGYIWMYNLNIIE